MPPSRGKRRDRLPEGPDGAATTLGRACALSGSSTGRTPDFGSGGWRFEPSPDSHEPAVQEVDRSEGRSWHPRWGPEWGPERLQKWVSISSIDPPGSGPQRPALCGSRLCLRSVCVGRGWGSWCGNADSSWPASRTVEPDLEENCVCQDGGSQIDTRQICIGQG